MVSKKRIAVWGLGNHAIRNVVPAINQNENIELYGLCSRNEKVLLQQSKEYKCISWVKEDEMLKDKNLDIIYISTPTGLHFRQGLKVLSSGKHLWCEKPITESLQNTVALIEAAKANNLNICEAFMYLYHPQYKRIKQYMTQELLGKTKSIHLSFGLPPLANKGFRDIPELGASCLLDVGSYTVSFITDLFPKKEIKIIHSKATIDKSTSVDQSGLVILEVDNKINCFLEWAYNRSYKNEVNIWCENGSLHSNRIFSKPESYSPTINIRDQNGSLSEERIQSINHFNTMLESFRNSIGDAEKHSEEIERITSLASMLDKIKESRTLK